MSVILKDQLPGLDFQLSENQIMIADMIRRYGEEKIKPIVMKYDESQEFPIHIFKELGEMGLMGVLVPEEYGGSGFGYFEYVTAISELAKICGSIGLSMAAHNSLCTGHILKFANEEQKKKYLPKLATAEWIGAWGLTEANTGSDAGNMSTTAVEDGDHYVLNGAKNFITHGKSGNVAVVIARTGKPRERNNATAFIVERGTPGFKAGKKEDKLGMRASETTEMIFEDCRVHKSHIIGQVGEGFKQALGVLDGGRISIAALGLGIAKGAFEASLKYAKERHQFDRPLTDFQAISFKLADMAMEIEAGEMLTFKAAHLINTKQSVNEAGAIAKLFTSEAAVRIANEAVQIHGGYGYIKDFPVEKYYRDAKLCTIGEGTSEIQKLVIARSILK
ncbi:acyl-CoA dehydrogenase family protein [Pontibacter sp. G13]|uniref:acyl-CoA dehydrogenase family protein n=1 Tax=Pontibacter sp. G13 TaxID=3074898 RepID=UPI00288B48A8|nr:acyl-CoA dehydrogenase family protein [Pontibacter sp. G13]WNJ18562.1 acyl-CoA dehydrogenase family protein [Pontibacter sp. G13]